MYYVQVQFTYTFYWSFKREKNILKEGMMCGMKLHGGGWCDDM